MDYFTRRETFSCKACSWVKNKSHVDPLNIIFLFLHKIGERFYKVF